MDHTPHPEISIFRTKRFWFRWAVPGLFVVLWVEGMLFSQAIVVNYGGAHPMSSYSFGMGRGVVSLESYRNTHGLGRHHWDFSGSGFAWSPGLELLPPPLVCGYFTAELKEYLWSVTIPLWLPLVLWLIGSHFWSRCQDRKLAALGDKAAGSASFH